MKITVLSIEKRPRWEFWKIDDYYVTVRVNDEKSSKIRKLSFYGSVDDVYLGLNYILHKLSSRSQFGPIPHKILQEAIALEAKATNEEEKLKAFHESTQMSLVDIIDKTYVFPDECPTCGKPFP